MVAQTPLLHVADIVQAQKVVDEIRGGHDGGADQRQGVGGVAQVAVVSQLVETRLDGAAVGGQIITRKADG